MPQLRDSSTSRSAVVPLSEEDSFARIFGVETEYGVGVVGAERPCGAADAATVMFQPVVSRARSTNTFLDNGARLYLDIGAHPEYATAETRDPLDALAQDLAGEQVMRRLALRAQDALRQEYGEHTALHVFKNNVDSAGNSFGCHENYLVRRSASSVLLDRVLVPMLVSRQVLTGAGMVTSYDDGFVVSQRAEFMDEAVSSATTHARPMINTRDEPHADSGLFRRLHVIVGDSNRSQTITWFKLSITHLVLCMIEQASRDGVCPAGLADLMEDPIAANRAMSRDLSGLWAAAVQRRYWQAVDETLQRYGDRIAQALPRTSVVRVMALWRELLDAVERQDWDVLAHRVDWVAKRRLVQGMQRRRGMLSFAQRRQIDLDYHDVAHGRIYEALLTHGGMERVIGAQEANRALHEPPADTRAAVRSRILRMAAAVGARYSCDWTHIGVYGAHGLTQVTMLDPFDAEGDATVRRVLSSLHDDVPSLPVV